MRFLTTLIAAKRSEYIAITIVLWVGVAALLRFVLGASIAVDEVDLLSPSSYVDAATYSRPSLPLFLVGFTFLMFAWLINSCRRLRDLDMPYVRSLLLFIPGINILFVALLMVMKPVADKTSAPFGNDPYNPQSWVGSTAARSGISGVGPAPDLFGDNDANKAA